MKYALMVMNMGIDGLVSEHPIHTGTDSDECFRKSIDFEEENPELTRVLEVNDDGSYIYVDGKYGVKEVKEVEAPDFYRARLHQGPWRWQVRQREDKARRGF